MSAQRLDEPLVEPTNHNNDTTGDAHEFSQEKKSKSDDELSSNAATATTTATTAAQQQQEEKEEEQQQQQQQQQNGWSNSTTRATAAAAAIAIASASQCWCHLPGDMIFTIASSLDSRSLTHLECVDRFTHSILVKRSNATILWYTIIEKSESKIGWMKIDEREQVKKLQQNCLMMTMKQENPKKYFIERTKLIQAFHYRLLSAQQNRLQSGSYKKRSLVLRWYDEAILPVCLFLLFTLFIIFLIYQLVTNDGHVTWMTMSPLLIFCGLITLSTCISCVIRSRNYTNNNNNDSSPIRSSTIHHHHHHSSSVPAFYDTSHFIPNDYAHESQSFVNGFLSMIAPLSSNHRTRARQPTRDQVIPFLLHTSLIFLSLLTCIIFLSLRVTRTIDWSWPFIFTPFFIAIGLIFLMVCFPSRRSGRGGVIFMMLGLLFFTSPIITFIILLTIYLNNNDNDSNYYSKSNSSLHLQYVFIPLYLIDGITFLSMCVPGLIILILYPIYLCIMCVLACRRGGGHDMENPRVPWAKIGSTIGWIVLIGPCLYVKIILGMRADGGPGPAGNEIMSNLALFSPILLPFAIIFVGLIFILLRYGGLSMCSCLSDRLNIIDLESRQAEAEVKVPLTVEEIENDERFVLTIVVEPLLPPQVEDVEFAMVAH